MKDSDRKKFLWLRLGLAAGLVAGGLLARRMMAGPAVPHLAAWQKEWRRRYGPARANEMAARVQAHYDDLWARHPVYAERAVNRHIREGILPGLALYRALQEESESQEAALAEAEALFALAYQGESSLFPLLKRLPDPFAVFRALGKRTIAGSFPPEGWGLTVTEDTADVLAFEIRDRCIYRDLLTRFGAPELTPVFCKMDDLVYGQLAPEIVFARDKTLGRGDECCNFRYARGGSKPSVQPGQAGVEELNDVAETLLIPLYFRARESRRPDALVKDPMAADLVDRLHYDFSHLEREHFQQINVISRAREFDRSVRAFLAENPAGVVVDIGCGLDTRFERLDNGQVTWYNLDLPAVIALRERLFTPAARCHNLACSALEFAWMDTVAQSRGPYFFLAEGVLPYLEETQVRQLVLALRERFPGSELLFDALPALMERFSRMLPILRKTKARVSWGFADNGVIEQWAPGIRLLAEWRYGEQDEPRLARYRAILRAPVIRDFRVLRYRLGVTAEPVVNNPYLAQKGRLLRDFDQNARRIRSLLHDRFGEQESSAMVAEAHAEYEALIPQMPYIGGKGTLTQFIIFTAWFLALYRVLKRRGYTAEDAGLLFHEIGKAFINAYPRYLLRIVGRQTFSRRHQDQVRQRAAASKHSPYPVDYVFDFVEGDGEAYDWGVNYIRCAGLEFLKAQGAAEIAPYICPADALYSDAFHWGLIRTKTLAEGCECCDFRFKKGGPTRVALPEVLRKH